MQRRAYIAACIMAFFSSVALACWALIPQKKATSGLISDSVVYDLGKQNAGVVRHPIKLTNKSARPIHLVRTITSCGCTTIDLPPSVLGAGESATVQCELNLRGRRDIFSTQIIFEYSEPDAKANQFLACVLKATVETIVHLNPHHLYFYINTPKQVRVELTSANNHVRLTAVSSETGAIKTTILEGGLAAEVTFVPHLWGPNQGKSTLRLETTCETERIIWIPVAVLMDTDQ